MNETRGTDERGRDSEQGMVGGRRWKEEGKDTRFRDSGKYKASDRESGKGRCVNKKRTDARQER